MSFRFNKRVNLSKGFGVHISKSGITPGFRVKRGSLSTKGYSIRTGIPGLTYRKTFSKSKNSGCLVVLLFMLVMVGIISCSSMLSNKA